MVIDKPFYIENHVQNVEKYRIMCTQLRHR